VPAAAPPAKATAPVARSAFVHDAYPFFTSAPFAPSIDLVFLLFVVEVFDEEDAQ